MQSWFSGRRLVIGIPYLWLGVFFLIPFAILFYISYVDMGNDLHPFKPLWTADGGMIALKTENYWRIFRTMPDGTWFDTLYLEAYWCSIRYALMTAFFCLLLGYPFAYFLARSPEKYRSSLLLMVMLPFWTSFLLRLYAWKGILGDTGMLYHVATWLGLTDEPLQILYTNVSMLIGMTYVYLPFMILPIYATLVKMDHRLLEAALDLGASPWRAFWLITVPLSKSGIVAGVMLVFIPAVGELVTPTLLGGPENIIIGRVVWDEMFSSNNWPRASALSVVIVAIVCLPMILYYHVQAKSTNQP